MVASRVSVGPRLVAAAAIVGAHSILPASAQVRPSFDEIWLYRTDAGRLERVTTASGSGRESTAANVSADGRRVVFQSDSDFRGEGIPNGTDEIWLYDTETRALTRITRASDPSRDSQNPVISADGSTLVFESDSDLKGEGMPARQRELWRYDVASGELTRLTRATAGGTSGGAAVNANGSRVAFHSSADFDSGAVASQSLDIWLLETTTGQLTRVTHAGDQRTSTWPALDAAGTTVAFQSDADLLQHGDIARGQTEVWLYGVAGRELTRVTRGGDGSRASERPQLSGDGTKVVFHSDADLLDEGRPDSVDEIWLYESPTRALRRLTSTWEPQRDADSNPVLHPDSYGPRITRDGRRVVFASDGDFLNEGLPNGFPNTWVYDLADGPLRRIDTSAGTGSGVAISADARTVVLFRTGFDVTRHARVAAPAAPPRPERLTAEAVARDLDAFQAEIEARWAYLKTTGVDYMAGIAALRERARGGIAFDEYAIELQKIISMFVDGHAGVGGVRYPPGYLPFLIEPTGRRFVAFKPDRSGFVDPDRPYVTHMDGRPIQAWIAAAAPFSPRGSAQYITRNGLRQIRYLQFQRGVMGLEQGATVRVQVAAADGSDTRELTLPVSDRGPTYGTWPETRSGLLDGNVGYLRIVSMNDAAVTEVQTWMPKFGETRGLIVDVRGNGGGSRDALRALFPYVMAADAAPRVVNAAKCRRHPDYGPDHLGGSRYMYPENWSGWSPAERDAIRQFRTTFRPQWNPPANEFSEWHYLVMSRDMNPDAFVYGRPVIILMDEKCFSATDIFVSAFKRYPNVTLVGQPSGGGSARRVGVRLPESGLSLGLASMASFQISGLLHDGHGTMPDVLVNPEPRYFLEGGLDNLLARALEVVGR